MERKVVVVCSIVGFLGLLTASLAFGAEATRIKSSQVRFTSDTECAYPQSPALPLGLTAAVMLVIAQTIVTLGTGCNCCRQRPYPSNSNWMLALICYVVSWFTFVIAFLLLLTGAALNDQHGEESMYFGNYYCYVVKPGVFAGGAVLSLASVTLGIFYYITMSSARNQTGTWGSPAPNQGSIAMGQPLAPPRQHNQDPVFVDQDTYMRRQLS
ncbi:DESIGUAL/Modifying wall lignin-1/2 [Dillenia turbinata]|uniref:DESIGUAL/Modifying wall lignin-1/2 n=1 Tax=Dillenia turbinata TaxID=194707 RepID=A0AAN8V216_9MAGN